MSEAIEYPQTEAGKRYKAELIALSERQKRGERTEEIGWPEWMIHDNSVWMLFDKYNPEAVAERKANGEVIA